MKLGSVLGDRQASSNLLVAQTHADQAQDFGFARGQIFGQGVISQISLEPFIADILRFGHRIILQQAMNRSGVEKHESRLGGLQRHLHIFSIGVTRDDCMNGRSQRDRTHAGSGSSISATEPAPAGASSRKSSIAAAEDWSVQVGHQDVGLRRGKSCR